MKDTFENVCLSPPFVLFFLRKLRLPKNKSLYDSSKKLQLLGAWAATTATETITSLENKHLGNAILWLLLLPRILIVDRARCNWTAIGANEVKVDIERFNVVCPRCRLNLFGIFTLSFGRLRQRIVLKCVPHAQHDYFSSFNQSIINLWRCRCRCHRLSARLLL